MSRVTWMRWWPALLVLLLAGCMRPENGPDLSPVDLEKAVSTRIAAGMEAMRLRDPERARRHLSRALDMDTKSAEAHNAMALLYAYERDDRREEEHYRKALRYRPDYSQARNNYASLLYRQGRYKEAIEQLERATEDTGYDQRSIAFLNLGRAYARVGQPEKAVVALERSLRLDSGVADTYLELADVLHGVGREADAREYLQFHLSRTRQTARSLWLGIRIEHGLGDTERMVGYELQLDSLFKGTPEHREWLAWKQSGRPAGKEQTK